MRFGSPQFFWLLPATPALIGFFIWAYQRKQAALRRFAEAHLISRLAPGLSVTRQVIRWTLFVVFFLFLVLSLVRPRFGARMEMVERKGVDIMIGLDISNSMLAEDIAPNRLQRAKYEIGKFIGMLKGDRVGIIIFAGESYVQCPLTLDYGAAKMFLDAVSNEWIQVQGTALADAIGKAQQAFNSTVRKDRVLILLSDGEDHEGAALEAARKAAEQGMKIHTVGIGSERGVPIPVKKTGGNVVYLKDNTGNLVMTRLNPAILEQIAAEGNGKYFHAGTDLDLAHIYAEIMKLEKQDLGTNRMTVYEERYQIFLAIALLFLLAEFFVPERVRRKAPWRGRFE